MSLGKSRPWTVEHGLTASALTTVLRRRSHGSQRPVGSEVQLIGLGGFTDASVPTAFTSRSSASALNSRYCGSSNPEDQPGSEHSISQAQSGRYRGGREPLRSPLICAADPVVLVGQVWNGEGHRPVVQVLVGRLIGGVAVQTRFPVGH